MKDFEFPYAIDKGRNNKSSATLFFAYIAFFETFLLIVAVAIFGELLYALIGSFVLFLMCIFFYRARRIDTLKVGKDGFEISDDDDTLDKKQPINESSEGWGSAK